MRWLHLERLDAWKILMIAAVLLLMGQVAYRNRVQNSIVEVSTADLSIGDTLPDLRIVRRSTDPSNGTIREGAMSLTDALTGDCNILAFFDSSCPICQDIAPRWSGIKVIAVGIDTLPVIWVQMAVGDTGAARFMTEYDLGGEWLALQKPQDAGDLGIFGTPLLYFVRRDGAFLGIANRLPQGIIEVPNACAETVRS